MNLGQAVELLEIADNTELESGDLESIKKRAQRRWHPDRIAHTNPTEEKVAEYQASFQSIPDAIEAIESYRSGESAGAKKQASAEEAPPEPEEAVVKFASRNQERLREHMDEILANESIKAREEVVLNEGISVKEALKMDLDDKLPELGVYSFGAGSAMAILLLLPVLFVAAMLELFGAAGLANLVAGAYLLTWFVHAVACVLAFAPLSRIWLPDNAFALVARIVDWPIDWLNGQDGIIANLVKLVLFIVSKLVKLVIVMPIYALVSAVQGEKMIFRVAIQQVFYGGYAENYLNHLTTTPQENLSMEELFDLAHASSSLTAR